MREDECDQSRKWGFAQLLWMNGNVLDQKSSIDQRQNHKYTNYDFYQANHALLNLENFSVFVIYFLLLNEHSKLIK